MKAKPLRVIDEVYRFNGETLHAYSMPVNTHSSVMEEVQQHLQAWPEQTFGKHEYSIEVPLLMLARSPLSASERYTT